MKPKICTEIYNENDSMMWDYWKYLLRICPFTGRVSRCPCKFCKRKVLGPIFSAITYGPNQRHWNFVCSPLSSCVLSHFKTRSSTYNSLFEAEPWLNHDLTICWCFAKFHLAFSLSSSNFNSMLILYSMDEHSISCTARASCNEGRNRLGGRIASIPYTKKKAKLPTDDFWGNPVRPESLI